MGVASRQIVAITCEVCGSTVEKLRRNLKRWNEIPRTCGRGCSDKVRFIGASSALPWRPCPRCGAEYYAKGRKHCPSPSAGVDYTKWRELPLWQREQLARRYYHRDTSPRPCAHCKAVFSPSYADKRRRFCSLRCARRYRNALESKRGHKSNRRISIQALGDRDGWRCHLCARKVTTQDATADHLIPQSQGGSGAPSNLRLAHRRCNSKRGARGPAQLFLITDFLSDGVAGNRASVAVSLPGRWEAPADAS